MHKTSQRNGQHKKSYAQQNVSHEANYRLQDAIKTKGMGEMTVVQRLLNMLYTQIWRHLKRKAVIDTQRRKVTDKIVASVFTKNK